MAVWGVRAGSHALQLGLNLPSDFPAPSLSVVQKTLDRISAGLYPPAILGCVQLTQALDVWSGSAFSIRPGAL
jgi:hypothetical protein